MRQQAARQEERGDAEVLVLPAGELPAVGAGVGEVRRPIVGVGTVPRQVVYECRAMYESGARRTRRTPYGTVANSRAAARERRTRRDVVLDTIPSSPRPAASRAPRVFRFALLPIVLVVCTPQTALTAEPDAAGVEFFEKKVRPLLVQHCHACHAASQGKTKGGLTLDRRDGALKGGDSGPAIVPGDPGKSRLIAAIRYENVDLQMPPKGKLPDDAVAVLTEWARLQSAVADRGDEAGGREAGI